MINDALLHTPGFRLAIEDKALTGCGKRLVTPAQAGVQGIRHQYFQ